MTCLYIFYLCLHLLGLCYGMYRLLLHMDQALYAKATEIAWKLTSKYANIILRMGTFHTIIGRPFQDAGLRDTCTASKIIAEGSVHGVLEERMYKRAVIFHKIIYEAVLRLAWKGFITWLEAHNPNQMHPVSALPDQISDARGEMSQAKFDELLSSDGLAESLILWNQFLSYLRHDNGNLSTLCMSYGDMIGDIILRLVRTSGGNVRSW